MTGTVGTACLLFATAAIYHADWIDFNKNGRKDVYEDRSHPVAMCVADLIGQMTIDEKICQLVTLYGSGRVLKDAQPTSGWKGAFWKDGIANIDEELNGVGKMFKSHYDLICPFSNHVAAVRGIQRWFVEETRLGIPVDFSNEGIHGLNHTKATTGRKIVLVLVNGQPLAVNFAVAKAPAILEAWWPSERRRRTSA